MVVVLVGRVTNIQGENVNRLFCRECPGATADTAELPFSPERSVLPWCNHLLLHSHLLGAFYSQVSHT